MPTADIHCIIILTYLYIPTLNASFTLQKLRTSKNTKNASARQVHQPQLLNSLE
jgi:hypothetical protein